MPITKLRTPETVKVTGHRVSCDGGDGALGHPKVYMDMGQKNSVNCKYCEKTFVLVGDH